MKKKEFKVSEILDDFIEHKYIDHYYRFCDYVSYEMYGVDESEFLTTIKKILCEYDGRKFKSDDDDDYFHFLYKGYDLSVFVHDDDIHIINKTLEKKDNENKEEYCDTVLKDRLK